MKASEVKVGEAYIAKVSGKLVPVKLLAISEVTKWAGRTLAGDSKYRQAPLYECINLVTRRILSFRSAAKFRHRVMQGTHVAEE